jgi:homoserine dehydrogenase
VAIVGCGTVGGATATLLTRDAALLRERTGLTLDLRYIVDVDFTHARRLGLPEKLYCKSLAEALADPKVAVVVELIGGTTIARKTIEQALAAGKHVVTANKALLAVAGPELYALARKNQVAVAFEASCAGGIPIIRALYDGLIANRIDALYGIVNGTCNHILTAMTQRGQSYAAALKDAQAAGLAEADPTLDVAGTDSAHKLAILAALAFGQRVDFDAIPVEGIDTLDSRDITYGDELGYVVKLLAIAHRQGEGLCLRVRPAFISKGHPLAWVSGPFNAVSVYGHATGHTMYYGRGAGGMPTASAVVADLAALATGRAQAAFNQLNLWPDRTPQARQIPIDAVRSRYYVRMLAADRPGVLAKTAAIFGRHDISISSVLQHEAPRRDETLPGSPGRHGDSPAATGSMVPVVVTTASALEGNLRRALAEVDALKVIQPPSVCIAMVDEHPEQL